MQQGLQRVCVAGAFAVIAGVATAGDDLIVTDWLDVGSAVLGAGQFLETEITLPDNPSLVAGFEVQFDYSEVIPDASWASDVQVIVTAPSGDGYTVGGLSNLPNADEEWSFQGTVSDPPGHYGDSGEDIFLPWLTSLQSKGVYTVRFVNDWDGDTNPNNYDNIQIRFYKVIPAPGGLALLGLAVVGVRRRRR